MAKKSKLREAVLERLGALAEGRRESIQDQMVGRFLKCEDWQRGSQAVQRGLSAEQRNQRRTYLSPPPGWLPPLG